MPLTRGHGNPDWTEEEVLLVLDLVLRRFPHIPGTGSTEVIELSRVLRALPLHPVNSRRENFRNEHSVYLKCWNLASLHPSRGDRKGLISSRTDREVWSRYWNRPADVAALAEQIRAGAKYLAVIRSNEEDFPESSASWSEGGILYRVHRIRERGRGYRRDLLRKVRRGNNGLLRCEGCGMVEDSLSVPSEIRASCFEVHHRLPLAQAMVNTVTRLRDLALVCANCHRLIHALMRHTGQHVEPRSLPPRESDVRQTAQRA